LIQSINQSINVLFHIAAKCWIDIRGSKGHICETDAAKSSHFCTKSATGCYCLWITDYARMRRVSQNIILVKILNVHCLHNAL